jgi:hypothetical protein
VGLALVSLSHRSYPPRLKRRILDRRDHEAGTR